MKTANQKRMTTNITATKRAHSPYQPTGQWITTVKRLAIYLRDGFKCFYCNKDLHNAKHNGISLDHVIGRAECHRKGLLTEMNKESNLVTACDNCNYSRAGTSIAKFMRRMNNRLSTSTRLKKRLAVDLTSYLVNAKQILAKKQNR